MLLDRYLAQTEFNSYQDFRDHFEIRVPGPSTSPTTWWTSMPAPRPDKVALVWCDDRGQSASFTFGQLREASDRTATCSAPWASARRSGDADSQAALRILVLLLALHKLGAIAIPATHQLTPKDLIYRNNAADVKLIVRRRTPCAGARGRRAGPVADPEAEGGGGRPAPRLDRLRPDPAPDQRRVRPAHRAGGLLQRGHLAALLHLGHHRLSQDGAPPTSPIPWATSSPPATGSG